MQRFYTYGLGVVGDVVGRTGAVEHVSGDEFGTGTATSRVLSAPSQSPVTWLRHGQEMDLDMEMDIGGVAGPLFALGGAEMPPGATNNATNSANAMAVSASGMRPGSSRTGTGSPPRRTSHSAARPYTPHSQPLPRPFPRFFSRPSASTTAQRDSDGLHAMEQIETQATDLRYLAQAPVPLSDTASAYDTPQPHASPSSASVGDNSAPPTVIGPNMHQHNHHHDGGPGALTESSSSNKRKSIDDGASSSKQTRSKRNRVRTCPRSLPKCAPPRATRGTNRPPAQVVICFANTFPLRTALVHLYCMVSTSILRRSRPPPIPSTDRHLM